jgi:hypothetical protein
MKAFIRRADRRRRGAARDYAHKRPFCTVTYTRELLPESGRRGPPAPECPSPQGVCVEHRLPRQAVAMLASVLDRFRRYLPDQTYESLARKAETITAADMVAYACDQIDQARAELNAVSE